MFIGLQASPVKVRPRKFVSKAAPRMRAVRLRHTAEARLDADNISSAAGGRSSPNFAHAGRALYAEGGRSPH